MALIGTIRKNGWILIVLMTLALGGFILMEIMSNAQRNSVGDANTLGKVNGAEIRRIDFERYQQLIYSNADASNSFQVREQAWEFFLENELITQEAQLLGLGVCRDELRDLEFGANISPIIKERYKTADGQVNMNYLNSVKNAIDADQLVDQEQYPFRSAWIEQEKEVIKERLEEKIANMVTKGYYTPSWQAEMVFKENSERLDFRYVRLGYDKVKDEEAPVTDADYSNFLKENPSLYDQTEETRVISYVSFDVIPTAADTANNRAALAKLADGLRSAKDDSLYVTSQNGKYEELYRVKDALPAAGADSLLQRSIGSVVGPFIDGDSWKIGKILDRKVIPDSVRARHILLKGANPAFQTTLDSLKGLLTAGKARFDSLAINLSQDLGSGAKGGDLGWFPNGAMVEQFNNVCFYTGEQGKLYITQTQFGFHLIEITGKKFIKNQTGVRAAYLTQRIEPGKATQQAVKEKAIALIQSTKTLTDFVLKATQEGYNVQTSKSLKSVDYKVDAFSGNDAREIVRWVFNDDTKVNEVSKEIFSIRDASGGYFDSKYVAAGLKSIAPSGKATVASLKALPDADLKVKNQKKGEYLVSKVGTVSDLSALAGQYSARVDTVRSASMMQAGGEPRILGTVFTLAKDAVSAPLIGNNGVYVVQPITDKQMQQAPADMTMFKRQMTSTSAATLRTNLMASLKKKANIRDNRARFF
jgi:peptidyl-prolyl cis-trans isomerase D